MSNIKIQVKRGTTAQVDAITPDSGEPIWETDGLKLALGDGALAGGHHVMMESLFNANTMLYATADDTPLALTIAASRIVGRKSSGAIVALTGAEVLAILTGQAGATFDWNDKALTGVGSVTSTSTMGYKTTATFVPDATITNYALSIGNRATELTVNLANAASQNLELLQMNVNLTASGGAPTSTSTVRLVRIRSTHDTVDMPNLRLMNLNTYMDVQKNLQDAYGQMNGIDFYTNAITIGGEAAVAAFNIDANSAVTGNVRGVIINMHGAGLPSTTSIGLEVRTDGGSAVLAEGIRIWSVGGNSITTGLYLDGTITTDIRFSGGATLVDDGTNLTLAGSKLKVVAPDISGVVTAASTLTMPAFTLGGTVALNGQVFDAGSGNARINTTGAGAGFFVYSTNAGAVGAQMFGAIINIGNAAVGDVCLKIVSGGLDDGDTARNYGRFEFQIENVTAAAYAGKMAWYNRLATGWNEAMTLSGAGVLAPDHSILFQQSQDLATVADQVSLGGYEISAGHRALAISSEEVVVTEAIGASDRTLPVRINGATYKLMLVAV